MKSKRRDIFLKVTCARICFVKVERFCAIAAIVALGVGLPNAFAVPTGTIYWTDAGNDRIQSSNLGGSGVNTLVGSGLNHPEGIAIDRGAGKIYWADDGTARIQRANLDGSSVENIVTGLDDPIDVRLISEPARFTGSTPG